MKQSLDNQTELQVVARIARGDTHESIRDDLAKEGKSVALSTISVIKKRNSEALAHIQSMMVTHETNTAEKILAKSRKLLERKVDDALKVQDQMAKLLDRFENEEIEWPEYHEAAQLILKRELSVSELTTLTKEMFNQSQVEAGKPTAITESPSQTRAAVERLLTAINNGDTVAALAEVFPDAQPQ